MSFDQFVAVIRAFERERVEYVLVGGVDVHGIVRTTEDVDFFVRPTPENVERIRAALRSLWADPHIEESPLPILPAPARRFGTGHRTVTSSSTCLRVGHRLSIRGSRTRAAEHRRRRGERSHSGHAVQDEARHAATP